MPAVPIYRDPSRYQGLPARNTIQAWTSLSQSTTAVRVNGRYIPRTIVPLPSLVHDGGPSGLAGLLTASSTLAPPATPSTNGSDIHQPWFKEPIAIVGLFFASVVIVCLILAILAHTTGFRWSCLDRDSFIKARFSSRSPPLPTSTHTASTSSDGQSGSTLFTTRRNIPRLYPKRSRQPVDGSSALSNATSAPESPYNGDVERAGGDHRYSYGDVNGMDRSAMSRVKRWVAQTLSTRPTCRGTADRDSLQSSAAAPFLTISDQHLWALPIADPREGLVPWAVSADPYGRNTNIDAAGSPDRRDWRVQKCPRPQSTSQGFPWKENLPCSGHEAQQNPRRSQVGDVERRGGKSPQGVRTEYARQSSYSHRAATQAAGVGQPGPRSRRSPSGCVVKEGSQQGDIQHGVSCQKQGRLAPPAPRISITPSSDASGMLPAHTSQPFPASSDTVTTDSRMEEETRKLLEYLASHTLPTAENEDTASFHSAAPTMTDINELLPPKATEHPRGPKSTSSTLHAAAFHPPHPGDQAAKKSNLRRSLETQSDLSLLSDESSPSYMQGPALSSSLLSALSPQLPDSGATTTTAAAAQNVAPSSSTLHSVPSSKGKKDRALK